MAKETVNIGNSADDNDQIINDVQILFDKVGILPTIEEYLKLAFIFNVKVPKPQDHNLDFKSIFQKFQSVKPNDNETLKQMIHNIFEWPFFKVQDRKSPFENLCRLRSFFQALTPIGISYIEGNHRGLLASKVLYGQQILEEYPLPKEVNQGFPLPANSPLYHNALNVKIILPFTDRANLEEAQLITKDMVSICRKNSEKIAELKKMYIVQQWKDFLQSTIHYFNSTQNYEPVNFLQYLNFHMPQQLRHYNKVMHRENIMFPFIKVNEDCSELLMECFQKYDPPKDLMQKAKVDHNLMKKVWKSKTIFGAFAFFWKPRVETHVQLTHGMIFKDNPLQKVWKHPAIIVYPELFTRVAPIEGGIKMLTAYSKLHEKYMDPNFIAHIILSPVKEIVDILMRIMEEHNEYQILGDAQCQEKNKHKIIRALTYWYTMRYLKAIADFCTTDEEEEETNNRNFYQVSKKKKEHFKKVNLNQSDYLDSLGELPKLLYCLPNEFIRWRNAYPEDNTPDIDHKIKTNQLPFNVKLRIHKSIINASQHLCRLPEDFKYKNHKSWDPYHIADAYINGREQYNLYDIQEVKREGKGKRSKPTSPSEESTPKKAKTTAKQSKNMEAEILKEKPKRTALRVPMPEAVAIRLGIPTTRLK